MNKFKYIAVAMCVTVLSFAQLPQDKTTVIKDSMPKAYVGITDVNPSNKVTLQQYVEELYINTCKLYNKGAIPLVESGEYNVLLVDKNAGVDASTFIKSKDLAMLKIEDVKEIRYEKSKQTDVMYGSRGGAFGIVVITK